MNDPLNPQDAVAVAQEQIALWLGSGLTPRDAWQALTGIRPAHASWADVRSYMIGWWQRQAAEPVLTMPLFKSGSLPPIRHRRSPSRQS